MTPEYLGLALDCPLATAAQWSDPITAAMAEFEIDTPDRQAAFIAQVGHESGSLRYVRELWGPLPEQARYEHRQDLGNNELGDGFKFRGRGLIQVTGRSNYARVGAELGLDLLNYPALLEVPVNAARSAALWWRDHGCNELADSQDFDKITATINLGNANADISRANGVVDRRDRWAKAKAVLT